LYKNALVYKSCEKRNAPVIVYHIWGDHAFFYDHKYGAHQLPERSPEIEIRPQAHRLRAKASEGVPFSAMTPFDLSEFERAVEQRTSRTFYCFPNQIKDIADSLADAEIPVWTAWGNRPEQVRALTACNDTKQDRTKIRVKVVPYNAPQLQQFCDTFSEHMGWLRLVYTGESQSVLFLRALNAMCTSRRINPPQAMKEAILERQRGVCALCEDPGTEFDHVTPLCLGGSNSIDNMRALCSLCHSEETDRLSVAGKYHTIESHMSPKLWRALHNAPKPKEVSFGAS
jgi:hypothetical protein